MVTHTKVAKDDTKVATVTGAFTGFRSIILDGLTIVPFVPSS
jgi:hypothetical protein